MPTHIVITDPTRKNRWFIARKRITGDRNYTVVAACTNEVMAHAIAAGLDVSLAGVTAGLKAEEAANRRARQAKRGAK